MSIWDKLKGELIDIIEWLDPSNDTMVYRYERNDNEIKYGAKLIVREGQAAVFVNEGQIADVFQPGTYDLETRNLPIISKLKGWKYGFESPFKAEVYFCSTRIFNDLKWGTMNPVMMRDKEFGPLRLRAYGTYSIRVTDSGRFIKEIVGTDGHFTTDEVTEQLRNEIVARFADILGEAGIPVLDLAANYDELGKFITERIGVSFNEYGLQIVRMMVENISLPEEVEKALDKRTSMGVLGDLNKYTQYQTAEAIGEAAKQPGGLAGAATGLGAGMVMAQQMAKSVGGGQQQAPQATAPAAAPGGSEAPPPLPSQPKYWAGIEGKRQGPYRGDDFKDQIVSGRITRATLVWRKGFADWTQAGEVDELKGLFEEAPPPLP